jgi:hypothetical protein
MISDPLELSSAYGAIRLSAMQLNEHIFSYGLYATPNDEPVGGAASPHAYAYEHRERNLPTDCKLDWDLSSGTSARALPKNHRAWIP